MGNVGCVPHLELSVGGFTKSNFSFRSFVRSVYPTSVRLSRDSTPLSPSPFRVFRDSSSLHFVLLLKQLEVVIVFGVSLSPTLLSGVTGVTLDRIETVPRQEWRVHHSHGRSTHGGTPVDRRGETWDSVHSH